MAHRPVGLPPLPSALGDRILEAGSMGDPPTERLPDLAVEHHF